MSAIRRWVVMVSLSLSAAVIYLLPYSTEIYYKPLQQALGLTNSEIGRLMSTLGIVSMLGYFPGGWLADRISARKLLSISLLATGLLGLYFATFPPFVMCVVVYAGWSLSSVFTFWGALIKATRSWGGEDEQGRAFGILEGARGLFRFGLMSLGLTLLGWFANKTSGFSTVVTLYSFFNIGLAGAVWWALRGTGENDTRAAAGARRAPAHPEKSDKPRGREVLQVLKLPAVWLIALVIFSAYAMYLGSFYFTPYASDAFGLGVVMAGYLGAGKMLVRPICAAGAGFLGDRVRASRVVLGAFLLAALSFGLFAASPTYSVHLQLEDVPRHDRLVETLKDPETPITAHLQEHFSGRLEGSLRAGEFVDLVVSLVDGFSDELDASLRDTLKGAEPPEVARASLLNEINERLDGDLLYTEERFRGVKLREGTKEELAPWRLSQIGVGLLLDLARGDVPSMRLSGGEEPRLLGLASLGALFLPPPPRDELTRVNRLLLEDAFPGIIKPLSRDRFHGSPPLMLLFLVVNVLLATLCLYALRGLYYALLEEGGVPTSLTGTATGIVSVMGYTPDIFLPPIVGYLLDSHPGGGGYRFVFGLVAALCLAGLIASAFFIRRFTPRASRSGQTAS